MLVAACGSSGGSKSTTAGSSTNGTTDDAVAKGVALAQQRIDEYRKIPTTLWTSEPLKKLPTGKSLYWLQCGVPVCKQIGNAIQEAGKTIGFKVTVVDSGVTPESVAKAWDKAAADKPDVIVGSTYGKALYESQLKTLCSAKIPYLSSAQPDPPDSCILTNLVPLDEFKTLGKLFADYVTAKSNGTANIEYFQLPDFPVLTAEPIGLKEELAEVCPKCKYHINLVKPQDIGTALPGAVVSSLQRNPDANWVAVDFGDMFTGVPQALETAGLTSRVKGISAYGSALNYELIKNGSFQVADVASSSALVGWTHVDNAARALAGQALPKPIPGKFQLGTQILEKADITFDFTLPPGGWPGTPDYRDQFKKMWGL
jgi:ribose transport system substrate-binding protein